MLTADAFGVLPPIARLSHEQALFYFLSGYTAKVAGTEIGVTEPQPTFSTCFGAPFLPQPPGGVRADARREARGHDATVWLVNTGWTGGPSARAGECRSRPRAACCTRRSPVRSTASSTASTGLRLRGSDRGAGRRLRAARSSRDVARSRARTTRARELAGCSRRTSRSSSRGRGLCGRRSPAHPSRERQSASSCRHRVRLRGSARRSTVTSSAWTSSAPSPVSTRAVTRVDGGGATLELSDTAKVDHSDELEVGRRVAGHVRVAFELDDVDSVTRRLDAAGATVLAEPVETPWGSRNARLEVTAGLQLDALREAGARPSGTVTSL